MENKEPIISENDLQRGREAFLARIKEKVALGKRVGEASQRLLQLYTDHPEALDREVTAQIRINPNDLLGDSGLIPLPAPVPEKDSLPKIGPVEARIIDLIDKTEDVASQKELLMRITGIKS